MEPSDTEKMMGEGLDTYLCKYGTSSSSYVLFYLFSALLIPLELTKNYGAN